MQNKILHIIHTSFTKPCYIYVIFVVFRILPTLTEGRLMDACKQAVVSVNTGSELQNPLAEASSCNL